MARPKVEPGFGGAFFVANQDHFRVRMRGVSAVVGIALDNADVPTKCLGCGK